MMETPTKDDLNVFGVRELNSVARFINGLAWVPLNELPIEIGRCPCMKRFGTSDSESGSYEGPVSLPSGHIVGFGCISNWILEQGENYCPTCRHELFPHQDSHVVGQSSVNFPVIEAHRISDEDDSYSSDVQILAEYTSKRRWLESSNFIDCHAHWTHELQHQWAQWFESWARAIVASGERRHERVKVAVELMSQPPESRSRESTFTTASGPQSLLYREYCLWLSRQRYGKDVIMSEIDAGPPTLWMLDGQPSFLSSAQGIELLEILEDQGAFDEDSGAFSSLRVQLRGSNNREVWYYLRIKAFYGMRVLWRMKDKNWAQVSG